MLPSLSWDHSLFLVHKLQSETDTKTNYITRPQLTYWINEEKIEQWHKHTNVFKIELMKIVRLFSSMVHFVDITPFAVCMQYASFVTIMIISYHVVIMILLSPKTWQHLVINDLTNLLCNILMLMNPTLQ